MGRLLAVAWLLGACVESRSVYCPSGKACPEATTCMLVAAVETCVTDEMLAACEGLSAGALCDASDPRKHCIDGVCIDTCGNNNTDPGEMCDDGNFDAGDGCSADCMSDETCGNGVVDLVSSEQCDDGIVAISGRGCSSTCQDELPEWQQITTLPISARAGTGTAFMYSRGQLVAFGGLSASGLHDETWTFMRDLGNTSADRWVQVFPGRQPPARWLPAMTYDHDRKRIVLFGGFGTGGALADTWEWDGIGWTNKTPATSPLPRLGTQIAYDRVRKKTVLYGGYRPTLIGNMALDDTWEWDGATWTKLTPVDHPGKTLALDSVQLGYHELRNELIYCGASVTLPNAEAAKTWRWDGVNWTNTNVACPTAAKHYITYAAGRLVLLTDTSPMLAYEWTGTAWTQLQLGTLPQRNFAAFTYDGQGVLVFGGATTTAFRGETFVSDVPGTWALATQASAIIAPTERRRGGVAYDPVRGRALVFGGETFTNRVNELWSFDAGGWRQLGMSSIVRPVGRRDAAISYDTKRDRLYVFAGQRDGTTTVDNETWAYGTIWNRLTTPTAPSARSAAVMTYDAAREVTILFGGSNVVSDFHDDTWSFDGTTWTQRATSPTPPKRAGHAMAYDPLRQRIVMFGGLGLGVMNFSELADTWEWDGTTWTRMQPATSPPGRAFAGLVYDPLRRTMVLFGGSESTQFGTFDDRWEWNGTTWTEITAGARLPRAEAYTFFDTARGALVTFGGIAGYFTGATASVWTLRYESTAPRETCKLADEDVDGDTLLGCADPDCWGRCTPLCPPAASCTTALPRCGDGTCSPVEDYLICAADCTAP